LLAVLLAGAVLLVAGRAFAFLYTEHAWYSALGATQLWLERLADTTLLQTSAFVAAAAFAFANLSAVRHSILSLVLPRRLGNVEFGEAVSPRRLDTLAVIIAVIIAAVASPAVPSWPQLALVRAGVRFDESDPYHQVDLSYYTTWLPLELELHRWAWIVVLVVALAVTALYALTPSLRWENGRVRMTLYVRRHLAVLAATILVMLAWRARLRSFTLLFDGSGPDAAFTTIDHRWLLPGYVVVSVATVVAAALFLWSSWNRQIVLSVVALAGVLILWVSVDLLLPLVVEAPPPNTRAAAEADAPYLATREAFTRRAFDNGDALTPGEVQRNGTVLVRSATVSRAARLAHVSPGARGYLIVSDAGGSSSPQLITAISRMAHAWREQDARLLGGNLPPRARILRVRDVSRRVGRLAPVFMQGSRSAALFRSDTLYWVTDLYTSFDTYPLSRRFTVAGARRGYFRHAATAFTNGTSGAVTIVANPAADPVARAWQVRFPGVFRPLDAAVAWTAELTIEPEPPLPEATGTDVAFRARVRELYLRMRAALSTSDLVAFGVAFDSLGALLERASAATGQR
jgi:uncharacterized membrane protein (UPF0182 family)